MTAKGIFVTGDSTLRFYQPTPAEQLSLYLRHGFEVSEDVADDMLYSFQLHHRIWWLDNKECQVSDGSCNCGPIALSDVLKICLAISPDLAKAAVTLHKEELGTAWRHFWSGDSLCNGGMEFRECCALCIGEGFPHIEEVGDEARNLSIEFGEAAGAHPELF